MASLVRLSTTVPTFDKGKEHNGLICRSVFGLTGAARGLDEGLIGTTTSLESFSNQFNHEDSALSETQQADRLSNIKSMVQMGSILGALVGFYLTDKLGRLWATRELCVIWVAGIAIFLGAAANGSMGMVYAGRFIAGVGIGQTTVVAPTYLAEISPRFVRGLCVCMFSGSVYLGIMLGYFASWGSSLHISDSTNLQWVVPNLLHIYFAAIIALLSFFSIESPRWLVKVNKQERASANLSKLRNLPEDHWYIQSELLDINDQLDREREATMGTTWFGPLKELVMIPGNRYRLMLSVMTQILGQWSGANSITIYAPEYFAMMGTSGSNEQLFATAIFGVVKFVSAILCALFLVDFVGRKRSLMSGITLQFIAMLYMALFLVIDSSVGNEDAVQTGSQKRAAIGAIVMIYVSGFGWALGWNRYVFTPHWHLLDLITDHQQHPIPDQLRDLSPPPARHRWQLRHDVPLRQSVRKQQGRARDVHWHDDRRHDVLLRRRHVVGLTVELVLLARVEREESGGH